MAWPTLLYQHFSDRSAILQLLSGADCSELKSTVCPHFIVKSGPNKDTFR